MELGTSPGDGGGGRSKRTGLRSPRALQTQRKLWLPPGSTRRPSGPEKLHWKSRDHYRHHIFPSPDAQPCPQRRHQPWLSPPSPGRAPRASAVTAQPPPVTAQPTPVMAQPMPRMAAVLSHGFAAHPASAWWHPCVWGCEMGSAPFLRLRSQVSPSLSSVPLSSTGLSRTGLHCREGLSFAGLARLLSCCWLARAAPVQGPWSSSCERRAGFFGEAKLQKPARASRYLCSGDAWATQKPPPMRGWRRNCSCPEPGRCWALAAHEGLEGGWLWGCTWLCIHRAAGCLLWRGLFFRQAYMSPGEAIFDKTNKSFQLF